MINSSQIYPICIWKLIWFLMKSYPFENSVQKLIFLYWMLKLNIKQFFCLFGGCLNIRGVKTGPPTLARWKKAGPPSKNRPRNIFCLVLRAGWWADRLTRFGGLSSQNGLARTWPAKIKKYIKNIIFFKN